MDDLKATDARLNRHKIHCFCLYQIYHFPVKENLSKLDALITPGS
jgi:hypothetical protein